jgi:expansin (peptidoglycan-binding protein)
MRAAALIALAACAGQESAEAGLDPLPDPPAAPPCTPERRAAVGTATHYAIEDAGQCSFGRVPNGVALAPADYAGGAMCGACLLVTGPEGQVVVRVVDTCPICKPGDLDLGRDVFPRIAPLEAGRVPIAWRVVACPLDGNLAFRFKDGTSAAWLGLQVRDHRYPLATVEARAAAGEAPWKTLVRTDYNYFIGTGLGPGPFAVRVTDTRGHTVEEPAVAMADPSTIRPGTRQLATCP